jgi:hypothetical protein
MLELINYQSHPTIKAPLSQINMEYKVNTFRFCLLYYRTSYNMVPITFTIYI